jgi:FkbH-like protein
MDAGNQNSHPGTIKCIVWDLDNTLWDGVLLEDDQVFLRSGVADIIKTLDGRGILHSIASKNDHATAIAKLQETGLLEYFLCPQIKWGSKVSSIEEIAKALNIGINTIAFIDDQPFEREEVQYSFPDVQVIDAADVKHLPDMPRMNPPFVTDAARNRRQTYIESFEREKAEEVFVGSKEDFLATLETVINISVANEGDLQRLEELTVRTNQLNSTGYTYSFDELNRFRQSQNHTLIVSSLEDRFGDYGKVGLALLEHQEDAWMLKLLITSCRVMSRGVGAVMLNHIIRLAKAQQVRLRAEFVPTDVNRMMYVTYRFADFKEIGKKEDSIVLLENNLENIQPFPDYVEVVVGDGLEIEVE